MPNPVINIPAIISAIAVASVLVFEQFYNVEGTNVLVGMLLLFCASYERSDKKYLNLERLGFITITGLVFWLIQSKSIAVYILTFYLVACAIGLDRKTFANFFGPIVLVVMSLLSVAVGMRSEVLSNDIIIWGTLLLALFASGRSSVAAISTLAPFLVVAMTKLELNQFHLEVSVVLLAWCFVEVSQRDLRRMAIASSALALWLAPQHPWVAIAIATIYIPENEFMNQRALHAIAIVLGLIVALAATVSVGIATVITVLTMASFHVFYKDRVNKLAVEA